MNDEQNYINKVVEIMSKPFEEGVSEIKAIENNLIVHNSIILNYYIGIFYNKKDTSLAKKYFERSIELEPLFTAPYYELANYYLDLENKSLDIERQKKLTLEKDIGRIVYTDYKKTGRKHFTKAEKLLMSIFNKVTIDYTSPNRTRRNSFEDNLRISSVLTPIYMGDREFDRVIGIYNALLNEYKRIPTSEIKNKQNYMICWKNIHIDLGQIYFHKNQFEEAFKTYANGFKYGLGLDKNHDKDLISVGAANNEKANYTINKYLLEACMLTRHYMVNWMELPMDVNEIYDLAVTNNYKKELELENKKKQKGPVEEYYLNGDNKILRLTLKSTLNTVALSNRIKIAYLTPDFNKNAAGLFMGHFLKYYSDKFEVYSYYTNPSADEYTMLFKKYKTNWFDVNKLDAKQLMQMILDHKIDILVDMIGHGHGNVMDCLRLMEGNKKRPIVITYLGYPDTTMLRAVDYRLVDHISDPIKSKDITEELLKLPRCFLCYFPFENEEVPVINYFRDRSLDRSEDRVRIGILNKSSKHSPLVIKDWKYILEKCKNCVLHIKLDQHWEFQKDLYKDLPQDQIVYHPFKDLLQNYYEIYNNIDFCIDTYPYSGTTTTCSSLYMGVPTFTKYYKDDPTKRHVSHVSASILLHCGFNDTVLTSNIKYRNAIVDYINKISIDPHTDTTELRLKRRKQFLDHMNPKEFMRCYEEKMMEIYTKKRR